MFEFFDLPYSFNSLEPYYNEETLKLHYELYKKYYSNLIKVQDKLEVARNSEYYENIKCLEKKLSFQGSGYILHKLFFENMINSSTESISSELGYQISKNFGSFAKFKKQFFEASKNIEGSGWGILVWVYELNKLEILQCEKHQNLTLWGNCPILVLDMWEHSYLLQYKIDKDRYINSFWNIINWKVVNNRFRSIGCNKIII